MNEKPQTFSIRSFNSQLKTLRQFINNYPLNDFSFDKTLLDFISEFEKAFTGLKLQFLLIDGKDCWQYGENSKNLILPEYSGFLNHLKMVQNTPLFKGKAYRTESSIAGLFQQPEFVLGLPFGLISGKRLWAFFNSTFHKVFRESTLKRFNSLMEKLVNKLELADYSEIQKIANQFKAQEEAVATLVHQLKSPLAVLARTLEVVENRPGTGKKLLGECRTKLNKTQSMISAYLDFMKIKEVRLSPVKVRDIIREVKFFFRYSLEKFNIRLAAKFSPPGKDYQILGHPFLAFQILQNLIENARIAVGANGNISIDVHECEINGEKNSSIEILVRDSGPGVDPGIADKIFEPFISGFKTGHGFGLGICRRIMQLHGGNINYLKPGKDQPGGFLLQFRAAGASPQPGFKVE